MTVNKMLTDFSKLDTTGLPSPAFIVDEVAIEENLKQLAEVGQRSGAKILAALKAFSLWPLGELTAQYLDGICASGIHEARLGKDHYCSGDKPAEVHVYSAAFSDADLTQLLDIADHIVFNSLSQWQRFEAKLIEAKQKRPNLQFGLRINPEHSEGDVDIYDPCAPGSRLGIPLASFDPAIVSSAIESGLLTGLHFHTLCEQDFAPLARTLDVVEKNFGQWLPLLKWINFGGGHHISRGDYQRDALVDRIKAIRETYSLEVYLEPGEAVAIGSGVLSAQVLDIGFNQLPQAILDSSATCHMPDTLEMPYRADILGAGEANEKKHTYRLGGLTCLAGDVMGDYSFDAPLEVGQQLLFLDMSHYTMVKTSTFNGCQLPALVVWNSKTNERRILKEFGYSDFKQRLG
ncbi:carboxynorspermidine decarboxylase [Reinekea marina]|uniref:Carboxynorspermidine/carboxyspermidine decarboxylase n=1 Tax=Reinekea marina TaxID=1310421 RepID=A0ABV7WVH2_9GAMM|nr:carboxynorspermidine decarboxylase [Reinekea marina]MDN3650934.1 carboxynorspermidine decarboxylase [Reinekea marina]